MAWMQRSCVGSAVVRLARNRCTRRFRLQTTGLGRTTLCVNSVSLGKFNSEGGFGADDLCSLCPAGRHAFHDGATACDVCEVGRASASDGTSACESCQAGYNGVREGLTPCGACELGRHAVDDGASFCDTCPRGTTANGDRVHFLCSGHPQRNRQLYRVHALRNQSVRERLRVVKVP